MVIPDEPELINAAVVTSRIPAVSGAILRDSADGDFAVLAEALDIEKPEQAEARLSYVPGYGKLETLADLGDPARLFRSHVAPDPSGFVLEEIVGERVAVSDDCDLSEEQLANALAELEDLLNAFGTSSAVQPCITTAAADAFCAEGKLFVNLAAWHQHPRRYWIVVIARELASLETTAVPEQAYQRTLETIQNAG
jgi:hypothetical protein